MKTLKKKEEWLADVMRNRKRYGEDAVEELRLAHVHLYCRHDPRTGEVADKEHVTLFAFDMYDGPDAAMPLPMAKQAFGNLLRATAVAGDAYAVISCVEVWTVASKSPNIGCQPKDHPDRQERVILFADHERFGQKIWSLLIERDAEGKRSVGPWELFDGRMGGLFFSVLPDPKRPSEADQQQARKILLRLGD